MDQAATVEPSQRGAGWISFAATMLVASGMFKILDAFWAFKFDDDQSEPVQTVLFADDLAAWGWLWLIVGVVLVAVGFAVMARAQWARAGGDRHRGHVGDPGLPLDLLSALVDDPQRDAGAPGRLGADRLRRPAGIGVGRS